MSDNISKQNLLKKIYDDEGIDDAARLATLNNTATTEQKEATIQCVLHTAQQVLDTAPNKEDEATQTLQERLTSYQKALQAPIQNNSQKFYHEYISPTLNGMAMVIDTVDKNDQETLATLDKIIPIAEENKDATCLKCNISGKTVADTSLEQSSATPTDENTAPAPEQEKPATAFSKVFNFLGKVAGRG